MVLSLTGCGILGNVSEPERYTRWGSELILAWDPPSQMGSVGSDLSYALYVRDYPASVFDDWIELGLADASRRYTFRIDGSELAPGIYEFGIRSVDTEGNESDMHTSTDWNADPPTGWVLDWQGGAQ